MAPPMLPKPTKKIERATTEKMESVASEKRLSPRKKAADEEKTDTFETTMSK